MSVTRNLMSSALFAQPFIGYQPVNISAQEPALTAANLVKQTMLGPPFKWIYNRSAFHVPAEPDELSWEQDYPLALPDYGFAEKIWLTDPDDKVTEITVISTALSMESAVKRPSSAALFRQDDDGNVTLRLNTLPDKPYTIDGLYQRAPNWMTSLAALWAPIPDHHAFIYDWGYLGFLSLLVKDARAPIFMGKFASHLLSFQDGLTAQQRNIFLGNFLDLLNQQGREQLATQQGAQGRANS